VKLDQLTFTRFIAAIFIVIVHYGSGIYPFNTGILHQFVLHSGVLVAYFFVLSGFIMFVAYNKNKPVNYSQYYINRFARIYPVYLVALILTVLVKLPNIGLTPLLFQSVLMQSWQPKYAYVINYTGWSLSTEMFFYLTFPLIYNKVYLRLNQGYIYALIIAIFLVTFGVKLYIQHHDWFNGNTLAFERFLHVSPLLRISEFLLGNVIGMLFLKIPQHYFKRYDILLLGLTVVAVLVIAHSNGYVYYDPLITLIFAVLIILIALNSNGYLTRIFSNSILVKLGEMSYSIYILQAPVWFIGVRLDKVFNATAPVQFGVYIIFLLLISWSSYEWIEVPARKLIRNSFDK
jgi:peptidoglycan/LPS O-acetylase OafA/YrhL